ncbi:thrombospondin type 1 domain protein, partial [Ostertagia ostertagi]
SVPTLSQFIISFLDRCSGTGDCKHGGYPHPSHCNECLCPNGLSGAKCEDFEPPRKAECGGKITVSEEWQSIESPGFPDPGYDPDQKCNWVFEANELNLNLSKNSLPVHINLCGLCGNENLSRSSPNWIQMVLLQHASGLVRLRSQHRSDYFRSQLSNDVGFKLQARATVPTTIAGTDMWAEWGPWSQCSRSCGGCGIMSRVRVCRTKKCTGRRQEFSTCNLMACPIDKHCAKLLTNDKICDGRVCTKASQALSGCLEPQCCPPFINVDGTCQSDSPLVNDFTLAKR